LTKSIYILADHDMTSPLHWQSTVNYNSWWSHDVPKYILSHLIVLFMILNLASSSTCIVITYHLELTAKFYELIKTHCVSWIKLRIDFIILFYGYIVNAHFRFPDFSLKKKKPLKSPFYQTVQTTYSSLYSRPITRSYWFRIYVRSIFLFIRNIVRPKATDH
jgi:hypothetical protein